jgi:biopolymer transport protein ExbB
VSQIGTLVQTLAKGGPVMIPLLACSIVALAVVVERLAFWWRQGDQGPALRALELAERGKLDEALEVARRAQGPTARMVAAGLAERPGTATAAMEAAAQAEIGPLRSYLPVLDTIITLSPLLGLLGTVTGMIAAFGILSTTGMNQPTAITGGVAEALIATAAGLAIAIATLVPYNYFTARAEQAMDAMERLVTRLDVALKEQQIP